MLALVLLMACTEEADTDEVVLAFDTDDTDTDVAADADADGHEAPADCDDTDADVFPGAYDLPNDGLDQDCDGADRVFDGVVVDATGKGTGTVVVALPVPPSMDIALVIDTSAAATDFVRYEGLDVPGRDLALGIPDAHWGVASFEDYAVSPYGSPGSDLPFRLDMPLDLDPYAAATATKSGVRAGADAWESGMEALYQALTGAGYDLGCDGVYDVGADVPAFAPSAADPFGGTGPASWTSATAGSGGGMGFRAGAVPVVLYVTDNILRDADLTTEVPGGCHADAGGAAVAAAAHAMGAWLIGGASEAFPAGGIQQMERLAVDSGSMLDLDGDGVDDPLVFKLQSISGAPWTADLDAALAGIAARTGADGILATFAASVTANPSNLGVALTPDALTDVDSRATPEIPLTIEVTSAPPSTNAAQTTSLTIEVLAEGAIVGTVTVPVEIVPL